MPTSFKPLAIAWAVSLLLVIGSVSFMQLTHDPTDHEGEEPATSEETGNSAESGPVLVQRTMPVEALPELLEMTDQGPLPIIGPDGLKPVVAYAANPVAAENLNKIALIVTNLGPIQRNVRRALTEMPENTTFAFSPYGNGINGWAEQARRAGHETLIMVPMEPANYPQNDPGPLTLQVGEPRSATMNLLRASLSKLNGAVGVIGHMGSRFTAAGESMRPFLEELRDRGLMYVDDQSSPYSRGPSMARALQVPSAFNFQPGYIDDDLSVAMISERLDDLEKRASADGYALGIIRAYPVSIDAVNIWAAGLESRGAVLVPTSQIIDQQPLVP